MRRFAAEAEILGRLRHPHIAQVYEAGWHDSGLGGVPWFAMELVEDARPLIEHAERQGLDVPARLELFALVCDAVQHGHGQGFIHRDLKPANILVDGDAKPRIIDFGVARSTDADLSIATLHTSAGELIGTLRYMSPEQCAGDPNAVDIRSDVYSLGVVLHELLTGAPPYDFTSASSTFDIPRVIREAQPQPLRQLDRSLSVDLETIVLKCLQKEPERRYQTVDDLGRDIRHYLGGEAIVARRDHAWYVIRKALLRHRAATAVAAAFILMLAAATVALSILYGHSESQRLVAEERAETLRRREYVNSIALASNALDDDDITRMLELLDTCPQDLRGWEWWHLRDAADDATTIFETAELVGSDPADRDRRWLPFAVQRSGNLAAIADLDGSVHLWNLETAGVVRTLRDHEHPVPKLVFSADGRRLATREGLTRSGFRVWDVQSGRILARGEVGEVYGEHCLSPDGRWYVAGDDRVVTIVDVESGEVVRKLEGHGTLVTAVAMSPDGRLIASGGYDSRVRLWDASDFREVLAIPAGERWVSAVAFSPDGSRLLWGDALGNGQEVEVATGRVLRVFDRQADVVVRTEWSPDGRLVLTATSTVIEVRDAARGTRIARLHVGGNVGGRPAFLGDSRRLVTGGSDGRLRIIDLAVPRARYVIGRGGGRTATSRDGRWAATAQFERSVYLWDLQRGALDAQWPAHVDASTIHALAFDPAGTTLASCASDRTIQLWSVPDGAALRRLDGDQVQFMRLAWSPDGQVIFAAGQHGRVTAWSARSGERIDVVDPGDPPSLDDYYVRTNPRAIAVSPDGRIVATSGHEGTIRLWSWPGFEPLRALDGHPALVRSLDFSPDGALLASAGHDGTFRLWDVATGRLVRSQEDRGQFCTLARFSPDGHRLLTSSTTRVYRLWEVDTGIQVLLLTGHSGPATEVAFSGDGRRIVSSGSDGDVRVWEAPGFPAPISNGQGLPR